MIRTDRDAKYGGVNTEEGVAVEDWNEARGHTSDDGGHVVYDETVDPLAVGQGTSGDSTDGIEDAYDDDELVGVFPRRA